MKAQKKATRKLKVGDRFKVISDKCGMNSGCIIKITSVNNIIICYVYVGHEDFIDYGDFYQYDNDFLASVIDLTELERALL
jgi:hypothetical protein